MPIYEYQCRECGNYLEKLQKLNDEPLTDCPACGKPALKRLLSAPSFRLKGSGWYETDFKGDKDKRRNLHESAEGGKDGASKSDSKPAAAAEKKAETKTDKKKDDKKDGKKGGGKDKTAAA